MRTRREKLGDTGRVESSLRKTKGGAKTGTTGTNYEGIIFVIYDRVLGADVGGCFSGAERLCGDDPRDGPRGRKGAELGASESRSLFGQVSQSRKCQVQEKSQSATNGCSCAKGYRTPISGKSLWSAASGSRGSKSRSRGAKANVQSGVEETVGPTCALEASCRNLRADIVDRGMEWRGWWFVEAGTSLVHSIH